MESQEGPRFEPPLSGEGHWLNRLANIPVFERTASATVEAICGAAVFFLCPEGRLLSEEGASAKDMFFLLEGVVRVFQRDGHGVEYTPKIFSAPTHCGDLARLGGEANYRSSMEALTPCVAARVELGVLERCLELDHGLALAWLRSVARQHLMTIDHDRQNMFGGLNARVANVLIAYAEVFAPAGPGLQPIRYPFSYGKLARQAGCTRRAAISVVHEFASLGAVEVAGGEWRIDRATLERARVPGVLGICYRLRESGSSPDRTRPAAPPGPNARRTFEAPAEQQERGIHTTG